jgi:hypothetical protein
VILVVNRPWVGVGVGVWVKLLKLIFAQVQRYATTEISNRNMYLFLVKLIPLSQPMNLLLTDKDPLFHGPLKSSLNFGSEMGTTQREEGAPVLPLSREALSEK